MNTEKSKRIIMLNLLTNKPSHRPKPNLLRGQGAQVLVAANFNRSLIGKPKDMTIQQRKQLGEHLFSLFMKDLESKGFTQYDLQNGKIEYPFASSTIYNLKTGKFSLNKINEMEVYLELETSMIVRDSDGVEKKF